MILTILLAFMYITVGASVSMAMIFVFACMTFVLDFVIILVLGSAMGVEVDSEDLSESPENE